MPPNFTLLGVRLTVRLRTLMNSKLGMGYDRQGQQSITNHDHKV